MSLAPQAARLAQIGDGAWHSMSVPEHAGVPKSSKPHEIVPISACSEGDLNHALPRNGRSCLVTAEMGFNLEEMTLHGVTIPKGATVLPVLLSANRDETVFEHADQLDLTRSPNRHLAFGQGIHYCIGAPLADPRLLVEIGVIAAK